MGLGFFAIVAGLFQGLQTFISSESARKNSLYQASDLNANAEGKRQQADIQEKRTEVEQRAKSREQEKLKQAYKEFAGENRSLIAAGNVDMTSGSALDILEGNANRYADDLGELEFDKEMIGWTGRREAQILEWEGDVMDSQASYLRSTAGSLGTSLLSGAFSGAMSGLSTYGMGGGFMSPANKDAALAAKHRIL